MIDTEGLVDFIHRVVHSTIDRRTRKIPCKVQSYNPKTHAVKVQMLPENNLTGWIPIGTAQTGNNFGFHIPPNINDPGWIEFHEGERTAPVWKSATFNDQFPPIQTVQAGEFNYTHKSKSVLYFKNDGTITHTSNKGMSYGSQTDSVTRTAQQNITDQAQKGNISRTAQNNITDQVSQGSIGHVGNTNVTGNLGVSQIVSGLSFNPTSDRRVKTNIGPFEGALDLALRVPVCRFKKHEAKIVKGKVKRKREGRNTFGVIAQDLFGVVPELVYGDVETEILTVEESKLGVLAIAALQELVSRMVEENAELRDRLDELEDVIAETLP